MSAEYRPDEEALPKPPWNAIYLANRDLAATVPINFVTHAAASLTSVCFANGVYEASQAEKCLSNLLAARFSRLVVDIFWDPSSRAFNLCPVSIVTEPQPKNTSSSTSTSQSRSTTGRSGSSSLRGTGTEAPSTSRVPEADSLVTESAEAGVAQRQLDFADLPSTSANALASSPVALEAVPLSTSPAGIVLYEMDSFRCSLSLNLQFIASLVRGHIEQTSNTLAANLLFLQFNLHAAASSTRSETQGSPLTAPDLPSLDELIGQKLRPVLSQYSYTPSNLHSERADLNDSWYTGLPSEQPNPGYFTTNALPDAKLSTSDGWPNEYSVELNSYKRILLGYGSVDTEMQGYDFAGDRDLIFPSEYLSMPRAVTSDSAGDLTAGCFYNPGGTVVSQANSSWAVSSLEPAPRTVNSADTLRSLTRDLIACGISPVLNVTLGNSTAAQNISLYVDFVRSTVWNWAAGEPPDVSLKDVTNKDDKDVLDKLRCALMITSSPTQAGRWRVEDCGSRHRVACRVANQPYLWRLSETHVPFSASKLACKGDSAFSAPRTGLENKYLHQHLLSLPEASRSGLSGNDSGVWVNLNSLDVTSCWVTTGVEGTCPYIDDKEASTARTVLVPTISALVLLILTALTIFVKCNKNRRNSRNKIRGKGGWDYEGVPS